MLIRVATGDDANGIWSVIEPIIRAGETHALPCNMTNEPAIHLWTSLGFNVAARLPLSIPIWAMWMPW